ncbi:MAG: ferrous iron transport protein B [Ruminococcaceae bacterium]|nr:ferrous iron transport protein B [Oscillospiraceae bacterium]
MGLTKSSVGKNARDDGLRLQYREPDDRVIALAGNPNVGKSTLFNALTGMHQHTGNWPGKTVASAQGYFRTQKHGYILVDVPGTYSLSAHSPEEDVARNFLCFGDPDAVIAVCDATCIERNLHLILQILESGKRLIVCVNLLDEAKRRHIRLDLPLLEKRLGVPVIGVVARKKSTLKKLGECLDNLVDTGAPPTDFSIPYPLAIEEAITVVERALDPKELGGLDARWVALRLLENEPSLLAELTTYLGKDLLQNDLVLQAVTDAVQTLRLAAIDEEALADMIITSVVSHAAELEKNVTLSETAHTSRDRRLDRFLTGRITGYPVMLLFLMLIFFLTVKLSNLPSSWLSALFFGALNRLEAVLISVNVPAWFIGFFVNGMLRVAAWVVSVMLPPMAIFFPLFTLLEDAGYLPRVAYNLDRPFARCHACGKQALTLCMGFGCNAAGVVGCRIIDAPRERLLAILTNSLVPCNGRFPALLSIITVFFVGFASRGNTALLSSLMLSGCIVLSILATLSVTRLLSCTLLRGTPSSFLLEMPPFRRPQVGQILIRSLLDRTLFVLARAVAVAAPAGAVLWLLANLSIGDTTLLAHCASFFDPFARLLGLDGVILLSFILGLPANEIVIPIMVMTYQATGILNEPSSLEELGTLLRANGWTATTAVCVLVFFLFHWPCSTTLLTIKRETGSVKWTAVAALLPTLIGMTLCALVATVSRLL